MPALPTGAVAPAPDRRLGEAARAVESMLLKQIVVSSGAFKGGESAGSAFRSDLFAQTLADALAQGGGIGLAAMLERSLGGGAADPAGTPGPCGEEAPPPRPGRPPCPSSSPRRWSRVPPPAHSGSGPTRSRARVRRTRDSTCPPREVPPSRPRPPAPWCQPVRGAATAWPWRSTMAAGSRRFMATPRRCWSSRASRSSAERPWPCSGTPADPPGPTSTSRSDRTGDRWTRGGSLMPINLVPTTWVDAQFLPP
jgi:hypothetical protein